MIYPRPLRKGDKITVLSVSWQVSPQEMEPFFAFARLQGWKVVYEEKNLYASDGLLAGSDSHRKALLQEALDDPAIRAIWFARGGHGSSRIWTTVDWSGLQRYPKWLIGFSDVTPLLWRAVTEGIVSLHAPLAVHIPHKIRAEALQELLKVLRGESEIVTIKWARKPWYAWRVGHTKGMLLGGNLSLLQTLCGTSLDLKNFPGNPILFWEEVGEYSYQIDRMSWHLRNGGWYGKIAGLLVGAITLTQEKEETPFGKPFSQIVEESTSCDFPLAMGLPVGHAKDNWPLLVGSSAELMVEASQAILRMSLQEP
ncbi:MAG: LD-carboxypeptidase [Bacteroidia bacterium]|nr:LD-carboxypeptidase [Bacteroidia bacterium]MDW8134081.1 LD-carboxypeptidase [Bacteroidia bacterium]